MILGLEKVFRIDICTEFHKKAVRQIDRWTFLHYFCHQSSEFNCPIEGNPRKSYEEVSWKITTPLNVFGNLPNNLFARTPLDSLLPLFKVLLQYCNWFITNKDVLNHCAKFLGFAKFRFGMNTKFYRDFQANLHS